MAQDHSGLGVAVVVGTFLANWEMGKMRNTITSLMAAASLVAMMAGTARADDIQIGVEGPITGSNAAFGDQMTHGAEQAVADLNAKGGVLGKQLVLNKGDDACDPKQAVSVANKFAGEGIKFVAGHFCSSSSIPASKAERATTVTELSDIASAAISGP